MTHVKFIKFSDGSILAWLVSIPLMDDMASCIYQNCGSIYMDLDMIYNEDFATPEEYLPFLHELELMGYKVLPL